MHTFGPVLNSPKHDCVMFKYNLKTRSVLDADRIKTGEHFIEYGKYVIIVSEITLVHILRQKMS